MTVTMSSREFNQETGRAKKEAESGPVFVTDRGEPSHVLLSIEAYRKLTEMEKTRGAAGEPGKTILELLVMPGLERLDDDFEIPTLRTISLKPVEFDD